jgi:hypothetical protein
MTVLSPPPPPPLSSSFLSCPHSALHFLSKPVTAIMPKAEKGTPKDIANRMKAKGLQKLVRRFKSSTITFPNFAPSPTTFDPYYHLHHRNSTAKCATSNAETKTDSNATSNPILTCVK